jgi:hypothetical protein
VLAWLPDARFAAHERKAIEWLHARQTARGTFGATQATIMALRALTAHAQQHRVTKAPGTLRVLAGTRVLAERAFAAGQAEPITIELWRKLEPGDADLRIELTGGGGALPWACDVAYCSERPADDPEAKVAIETRLASPRVEEGRTVSLEVTVRNRTVEGQPMTLATIGLPAGLEIVTSVLDDRRKAGAYDLWELRGRELSLYWRGLAPAAERRFALDLVARIPGTSTGPASRAYLYYTPQQKRWAAPLAIEVEAR